MIDKELWRFLPTVLENEAGEPVAAMVKSMKGRYVNVSDYEALEHRFSEETQTRQYEANRADDAVKELVELHAYAGQLRELLQRGVDGDLSAPEFFKDIWRADARAAIAKNPLVHLSKNTTDQREAVPVLNSTNAGHSPCEDDTRRESRDGIAPTNSVTNPIKIGIENLTPEGGWRDAPGLAHTEDLLDWYVRQPGFEAGWPKQAELMKHGADRIRALLREREATSPLGVRTAKPWGEQSFTERAVSLLRSARQEIHPVKGETGALCDQIDWLLAVSDSTPSQGNPA